MTCDRFVKSMRQVTFRKRAIAIITDLIWNGYSLWGTYQSDTKSPLTITVSFAISESGMYIGRSKG